MELGLAELEAIPGEFNDADMWKEREREGGPSGQETQRDPANFRHSRSNSSESRIYVCTWLISHIQVIVPGKTM